jgi:YjbE family integral membrane protein
LHGRIAGQMNFPALGTVSFDMTFLSRLMSITLINLVLSGDNAVVIAMAARALPKEHRLKGIVLGAAVAVLLRVVFTFFVAEMLGMDYVRLIGGAVIVWIAIKLFVEDEEAEIAHKEAASLWQAIWIIVVADLTMALDNMLAVGAASHGNLFLLLIGLGLSIPFIVFGSTLLSRLIERFPIIIYIGAALLGKIGGEMIITDPVVARFITPTGVVTYSVEIAFAAGVILIGKYWLKRDMAKQGPAR